MSIALVLLSFALVLGWGMPWMLSRCEGLESRPRLAITVWMSFAVGLVLSLPAAGLAMLLPMASFQSMASDFLNTCLAALRSQYGSFGGSAVGVISALLVFGAAARLTYLAVRHSVTSLAQHRRHSEWLATSARWDDVRGCHVVDHPAATAYCLADRDRSIVMTTGAIDALDAASLRAVLAHERAHLFGRHHLVASVALLVGRFLPVIPLLGMLPARIGHLLELCADRAATRTVPARDIAQGILAFAEAGSAAPHAALAASGGHALSRVRHLLGEHPTTPAWQAGSVAAGSFAAAAFPVLAAALPLAVLAQMSCY
ncbi:M56 family metallopeptidase [Haloglycomyces albus]|uniref:M56 family metallopeptidase n=1 Tax=Haloglycomyces albus TaxID=526067 RepID=UPI00046D7C97|nr:M56 family metallopeptidase [Haloglycomyces albus]